MTVIALNILLHTLHVPSAIAELLVYSSSGRDRNGQ